MGFGRHLTDPDNNADEAGMMAGLLLLRLEFNRRCVGPSVVVFERPVVATVAAAAGGRAVTTPISS